MSDPAGILREVNAAIERGDPRSATHLLTDDFVLEDVALGRSDGPEAAVGRWTVLTTAFPDLSFRVARELVSGEVVVQEQVLEGHHRGPFLDIPPTGAAVRFRSAVVAEERGGRLATMRLYRDYSSFVAQFAFLSRAAVIAATLNRTVPIAAVVGTVFTLINQLPKMLGPGLATADVIRVGANYLVPLIVSSVSALTFRRPPPGKLPGGPFGRLLRPRIERSIRRMVADSEPSPTP